MCYIFALRGRTSICSLRRGAKKEMYAMADDRLSADRGKAIEAALANIEKKFGKGSIMRLGERDVSDIPAISTTSLSLDAAVGVGGVPRGRIVEIYGPESGRRRGLHRCRARYGCRLRGKARRRHRSASHLST